MMHLRDIYENKVQESQETYRKPELAKSYFMK
jgi:hypothetical protein